MLRGNTLTWRNFDNALEKRFYFCRFEIFDTTIYRFFMKIIFCYFFHSWLYSSERFPGTFKRMQNRIIPNDDRNWSRNSSAPKEFPSKIFTLRTEKLHNVSDRLRVDASLVLLFYSQMREILLVVENPRQEFPKQRQDRMIFLFFFLQIEIRKVFIRYFYHSGWKKYHFQLFFF